VGDRARNLHTAIAGLNDAGMRVTRVSSFYETEPVDLLDQAWFLNCALEGETDVPALELLRALRGIESLMGSRKLVAKGPRLIDMDILLYGSDTIDITGLQVPHPRMHLAVRSGSAGGDCAEGGAPDLEEDRRAVARRNTRSQHRTIF